MEIGIFFRVKYRLCVIIQRANPVGIIFVKDAADIQKTFCGFFVVYFDEFHLVFCFKNQPTNIKFNICCVSQTSILFGPLCQGKFGGQIEVLNNIIFATKF
jgi:hypothetical protein